MDPTFTANDEALHDAAQFFKRAATICTTQAEQRSQERDRAMLEHVGDSTQLLARDIRGLQDRTDDPIVHRYVQYRPAEPLPGQETLQALQQPEAPVEELVATLEGAGRDYAALHETLQARASTPQAKEFHTEYRKLLTRWSKHLSSAVGQAQDL